VTSEPQSQTFPEGDVPAAASLAVCLLREVVRNCYEYQADNRDLLRFPPRNAWNRWLIALKGRLLRALRRCGLVYTDKTTLELGDLLQRTDELEAVYRLLAGEESRQVMVNLLAFKTLGAWRVRLLRNNAEYWQKRRFVQHDLLVRRRSAAVGPPLGHLDYYELDRIGFPIRLHAHALNVLNTFLLEQYRCDRDGVRVAPEPGDVVIDGGACWGDTSFYFADRVGEKGRVYCFEFVPANLQVLEQNIELNPALASRLHVVRRALWSCAGAPLALRGEGPASRLVPARPGESSTIALVALDDFVEQERLPSVDFVKLDVEGVELEVLRGAERTLRRWRPKLAISVYHQDQDLITIPRFLHDLGLGYRFALDHFTIHREETVLFADGRQP
jgi:FkbM family methyltransferase